jgi:conjugal transfer pilus assembly protein TraV
MRVIGLLILLILSGCSAMNGDFTCSQEPGVMCRSLDQVNSMVNRGEIGGAPKLPPPPRLALEQQVVAVWLAPYEDQEGNYHDSTKIYTTIRPNRWEFQGV